MNIMNMKPSGRFWIYLLLVTLCPSLTSAQVRHTISGRVVDNKTKTGVDKLLIIVQRDRVNIASTTTKDTSGKYSVSFDDGDEAITVVYGGDTDYLPNSVFNLSGKSDHSITKVVSRHLHGQQLSSTQAAEASMTLEFLLQYPGLYGSLLISYADVLKKEDFPPQYQDSFHRIEATVAHLRVPVEGSYVITAVAEGMGKMTFTLLLKKDGDKWVGEIKDSPQPWIVNSITVDTKNKITVTADAGGSSITLTGQYGDNKIVGDWVAGDLKGSWQADKKASTFPDIKTEIAGFYDFTIPSHQGVLSIILAIKNDNGKLVASSESGGALNITGITLNEDGVIRLTAMDSGNNPVILKGKREGGKISGILEGDGSPLVWTAKKQ
jgi:hypothetical protein